MGIVKHKVQLQKSRIRSALTKNKNKGYGLQWIERRTHEQVQGAETRQG